MTRVLAATLIVLAATSNAHAEGWQHTLTPYIWGAGISGTTTVGTSAGPIEAPLDSSFGDILQNLKMAGMVSYRGERDRWAVMVDVFYVNLEADQTSSAGRINATATVKQTIIEADVGHRLTERILAFIGLRYNDVKTDVEVTTTPPGATRAGAAGAPWADPVLGVLGTIPLNDRWSLDMRGDIGGFNLGSKFAWQAVVSVRWQATKTIDVVGGYRYLDMDFETGSGPGLFKYDMATSGPGLGVAFRF